jgi:hypothetical protein
MQESGIQYFPFIEAGFADAAQLGKDGPGVPSISNIIKCCGDWVAMRDFVFIKSRACRCSLKRNDNYTGLK